MGVFHVFKIVQMVSNCANHLIEVCKTVILPDQSSRRLELITGKNKIITTTMQYQNNPLDVLGSTPEYDWDHLL